MLFLPKGRMAIGSLGGGFGNVHASLARKQSGSYSASLRARAVTQFAPCSLFGTQGFSGMDGPFEDQKGCLPAFAVHRVGTHQSPTAPKPKRSFD